jgi:transcriptional regulator with XRE-family HTH domain
MKVTNSAIALIRKRFRDPSKPKINQSQLADFMGYGKAWVSKLMNGKLQSLNSEQVEKLEEFLGIRLESFADKRQPIPTLALEIAAKIQACEPAARIVSALLELDVSPPVPGPKWIETKDMTKVGQEIIRIAYANEDKPGKVARLVLELLA